MCEHLGVPFEEDEELRESYKRFRAKMENKEPAETSVKQAKPKRATKSKKKS